MLLLLLPWQIANALLQYAHYGSLPLVLGLDKAGMLVFTWWLHLATLIIALIGFPLVLAGTLGRLHDLISGAEARPFSMLATRYYGRVLWLNFSGLVIIAPLIFFWYFALGELTKDPFSLGIVYSLYLSPLGITLLLTLLVPAVMVASWMSLAVVAVFDDEAGALHSAFRSFRYIMHNMGLFLALTFGTVAVAEIIYYLAMEIGRHVSYGMLVERITLAVIVSALFVVFAGLQTAFYHGRKRRVAARM